MSFTLIEFFDDSHIKNIVAGLALRPEKIVFIGSNLKRMKRSSDRYLGIFRNKGFNCEIGLVQASANNLTRIYEALEETVRKGSSFVIDLTGGSEFALVAAGMILGEVHDFSAKLIRFNLHTCEMVDYFGDSLELTFYPPALTVEENIALHGSSVVYENEKEGGTVSYDWSSSFKTDVDNVWSISLINPKRWNKQITQISGSFYDDFSRVFHKLDADKSATASWSKSLFRDLLDYGVIFNFQYDDSSFGFDTKNEQVGRLLSTAGRVLELKTALIAMEAEDKGKPFFDDVLTGVFIDWDGEVHSYDEKICDTENEIDLICMRGLQPLFISCKNGSIEEAELYKFNTVAQRFGGENAKKAIVITYLDKGNRSMEYFRQRARDMDIHLIEGVGNLSDEVFTKKLKAIFG